MIGNSGIEVGFFVVPDPVASYSHPVKRKTERFKALYYLSVSETGRGNLCPLISFPMFAVTARAWVT